MECSELASRLNAKPQGQGRWIAKCPAHEDRTPSLAIREADDGRVLMHCFGGCGIDDICGALGIEITDLFPTALVGSRPAKFPVSHRELLEVIRFEATVVLVAARDVKNGKPLADQDEARLWSAITRINEALEVAA